MYNQQHMLLYKSIINSWCWWTLIDDKSLWRRNVSQEMSGNSPCTSTMYHDKSGSPFTEKVNNIGNPEQPLHSKGSISTGYCTTIIRPWTSQITSFFVWTRDFLGACQWLCLSNNKVLDWKLGITLHNFHYFTRLSRHSYSKWPETVLVSLCVFLCRQLADTKICETLS